MIKTITYNPETHVLVPREPNPDWCAGCSPDNCSGCGDEPVDSEPAMWVMKHIRSGDLAQAKPNQKALHPYMWSDAFPRYTTPQPDRTAELEQLRQQLADSRHERDICHAECIKLTNEYNSQLAAKDEVIAEAGEMLAMRDRQLAALKAENESLKLDAERYQWLRDVMSKSIGGGVEVNDAALVYETSEPGEEVRVYWYPNTPIGFYDSKGSTLDQAIDAAIAQGEK